MALLLLPSALLLWGLGLHLSYPRLQGINITGGLQLHVSLMAMWLALSIYSGAFIAEDVRAGILAISKGQNEPAAALGRTMRLVILPQALRVIDLAISQYYQECLARPCRGLHGPALDAWRHHHQPDRP